MILDNKSFNCLAKKCREAIQCNEIDRFFEGKLVRGLGRYTNYEVKCSVCKAQDIIKTEIDICPDYFCCKRLKLYFIFKGYK